MINKVLFAKLELFFSKERQSSYSEEIESEDSFNSLEEELKMIFPKWWQEVLTTFPMNGLNVTLHANTDEEINIEFVGFEEIQHESLELYPGCAIKKLGYICIAEDPTGSGDPFFINIHEGDNPPVYQIYHDAGSIGSEIVKNGKEKVANRLSELFS